MTTKKLLALLCACAGAQAQASAADTTPVTGNVDLVSDYRFRGISQSWRPPAVQGGFDTFYKAGNSAGLDLMRLGNSGVVLSVAKTFQVLRLPNSSQRWR